MKKIIAICCIFLFLPFFSACTDGERTTYTISAEYFPTERTLSVTQSVDYRNTTGVPLESLPFNIPVNAYREGATHHPVSPAYHASAYYGKVNYGGLQIKSVSQTWEIGGEDENLLLVSLSEPLEPNERVKLDMTYEVSLASVNHRLGVTEHTVNLGNFYPVLCAYDDGFYPCVYEWNGDPFYSECADYTVTLTVPSEYKVAQSGKVERTAVAGSKTSYTARLENAREYAAVFSTEFSVRSEAVDGVILSYYSVGDTAAELSFQIAKEALLYYNEAFGSYPYPTLAVAETGFCYGGMEYPALVMLSESLTEENRRLTLVHELAHQWWYAAVGNNQAEQAWMDEGLVEYSGVLFFESHPAYGITRSALVDTARKAYRSYVSIYAQIFGKTDTSMIRNLKDYLSEYEYVNLVYHKGLLLFDGLRESIGDERFFQGLREYYRSYCFKVAKPQDLIASFRKTGVDIDGYFASFLEGNVVI